MEQPTNFIRVGNQELVEFEDRIEFKIHEVKLHRGYRFKFGLRDVPIKQAARKNKPLKIIFDQHPETSFTYSADKWLQLGELKDQVGNDPKHPMKFYWYYLNYSGELSKVKQAEGQEVLL